MAMKKILIILVWIIVLFWWLVAFAETVEECKNRIWYILWWQGAGQGTYAIEQLKKCETVNSYISDTTSTSYSCDIYWSHSYYDWKWSCKCDAWYSFMNDAKWDTICKSLNDYCHDKFWLFSSYNSVSESCECWYWYVMVESMFWWYECKHWDSICHDKLWTYSRFNSFSDLCECKEGYTIRDWKCQEEAISLYAHLNNVNENILTVSYIDPITYLPLKRDIVLDSKTYLSDCWDINNYIWKNIVLNFMYDKTLSMWDYVVLPESDNNDNVNQHCIITSDPTLLSINNKPLNSILVLNNNSELQNSVTRMYNNWLTSFQTVADFNWDWELTREQASKFFTQFTKIILGKNPDKTQIVKLSDLNKADKTLQPYIIESNQLWLFKWIDWKFYPFNKLTRAQAVAVLMRAREWYQNESIGKRYSEYYNLADSYWLLNDLWFYFETLDSTNIKRKEIALMLYRLSSK